MSYKLTIAGKEIEIAWTQKSARAFRTRMQKYRIKVLNKDFNDPSRADYAYAATLFCLLPDGEYSKYENEEKLAEAIEDEDVSSVVTAVCSCIGDMVADAEKKSSLRSEPLPESN